MRSCAVAHISSFPNKNSFPGVVQSRQVSHSVPMPTPNARKASRLLNDINKNIAGHSDQHLAAVVALLLPHLDTLDGHLSVLLPCGQPLLAGVPEVTLGSWAGVNPWLALNTVLEPTVGATNSDVEDEVEILVEGSGVYASLAPWVDETSAVGVRDREVALLPEWLVEVDVHDLKETSVDVREDVLLAPFETESVETRAVSSVESLTLDVVLVPAVVVGIRTPVKSGRDDVVAALRVGVVVTARLNNVDLTRRRPWAVGVVNRQHPNGWPEPVTGRQLSLDFDTAVLDGGAGLGVDTSRFDRVDNSTVGGVGDRNAVRPFLDRAAAILEKVDNAVFVDKVLVLQSRLDDEHAVLDKGVLVGVGSFLELTVAVMISQ